MKTTIRDFRREDYDELIRLWEQAGLPYKPQGRDRREEIARQMQQPTSIYLVAEIDDMLVGSVLATHDGRKGWINRLAVLPSYRQLGLARRLIEEAEKRLSALGIAIYAGLVEEGNNISMKVFEGLGYQRRSDLIYFNKRKHPDV